MQDTDFEAAGRRWSARRKYRKSAVCEKLVHLNVEVSPHIRAGVSEISAEEGLTMAEVTEKIIDRFLKKRAARKLLKHSVESFEGHRIS